VELRLWRNLGVGRGGFQVAKDLVIEDGFRWMNETAGKWARDTFSSRFFPPASIEDESITDSNKYLVQLLHCFPPVDDPFTKRKNTAVLSESSLISPNDALFWPRIAKIITI